MLAPALTIDRLCIRFGSRIAVDDLTLDVAAGEAFALLGGNGSGKSTTLSVAAGIRQATSGTVRVMGDTRADNPDRYARRVGFVPQDLALYEELTAADNLALFGGLYGLAGRHLRTRAAEALEFVGLADAARRRVRTLSGGQQRRIHLACGLLHEPLLLLLDEPTVGLDAESRADLLRRLGELRERGCTIVLTTHRLDEAEILCDRAGVLAEGRLLAIGRPAEMASLGNRCVLEAIARDPLDELCRHRLDRALEPGVYLQASGRALRLEAGGSEALSRGLAAVLAEGVVLETVNTTAGPLAARDADSGLVGTVAGCYLRDAA